MFSRIGVISETIRLAATCFVDALSIATRLDPTPGSLEAETAAAAHFGLAQCFLGDCDGVDDLVKGCSNLVEPVKNATTANSGVKDRTSERTDKDFQSVSVNPDEESADARDASGSGESRTEKHPQHEHPLTFETCADFEGICDVCGRDLSTNTPRFCCEPCDFDACEQCVQEQDQKVDVEALQKRGMPSSYTNRGHFLCEATRLAPNSADYYIALAQHHLHGGLTDEAEAAFYAAGAVLHTHPLPFTSRRTVASGLALCRRVSILQRRLQWYTIQKSTVCVQILRDELREICPVYWSGDTEVPVQSECDPSKPIQIPYDIDELDPLGDILDVRTPFSRANESTESKNEPDTQEVFAPAPGDLVTLVIDDSEADWTGNSESRLAFSVGNTYTISEISGDFFCTTTFGTLWAPLSATDKGRAYTEYLNKKTTTSVPANTFEKYEAWAGGLSSERLATTSVSLADVLSKDLISTRETTTPKGSTGFEDVMTNRRVAAAKARMAASSLERLVRVSGLIGPLAPRVNGVFRATAPPTEGSRCLRTTWGNALVETSNLDSANSPLVFEKIGGNPAPLSPPDVNLDDAPVSKGSDPQCAHLYYCGRELGKEKIPGSDGKCGPSNGPQCAACQAYQERWSDRAPGRNDPTWIFFDPAKSCWVVGPAMREGPQSMADSRKAYLVSSKTSAEDGTLNGANRTWRIPAYTAQGRSAGDSPQLDGNPNIESIDDCGVQVCDLSATTSLALETEGAPLTSEQQALVFAVGSSLDVAAEFHDLRKSLTLRVLRRVVTLLDGLSGLPRLSKPPQIVRSIFNQLRAFLDELLSADCDGEIATLAVDCLLKLARSNFRLPDLLGLVRSLKSNLSLPEEARFRAGAEFARLLSAADSVSKASFANRPLSSLQTNALADSSLRCLVELSSMLLALFDESVLDVRKVLQTGVLLRLSLESAAFQNIKSMDGVVLQCACIAFDRCSTLPHDTPDHKRLVMELSSLIHLSVQITDFDGCVPGAVALLSPQEQLPAPLPSNIKNSLSVVRTATLATVTSPAGALKLVQSKRIGQPDETCLIPLLELAVGNDVNASEARRIVQLVQLAALHCDHQVFRELYTTSLIDTCIDQIDATLSSQDDSLSANEIFTRIGSLLGSWLGSIHKTVDGIPERAEVPQTLGVKLLLALERVQRHYNMPRVEGSLKAYSQNMRGMVIETQVVESEHPYENDFKHEYTLTFRSKRPIRVLWDAQCSTERNCDFVVVNIICFNYADYHFV